jgi:hypothetical protein
MRSDPSGECWQVAAKFIYAALVSWVYNAARDGIAVQNNGGDFWTGFANGLANNPSVSVSGYYDGNGNVYAGERPATTGSIADVYIPDIWEDVTAITYNYNDVSSQASVGDIFDLCQAPIIQLASISGGGALYSGRTNSRQDINNKYIIRLHSVYTKHIPMWWTPYYVYHGGRTIFNRVTKYDKMIDITSKKTRVPQEMIAAILFREIACYSIADKNLDYSLSKLGRECSIGEGQIFPSTAIRAEIIVYDQQLHSEGELVEILSVGYANVYYVGLVLQSIAKKGNINLQNATSVQIETVISRYNGTNDNAARYGRETMEYYEVFKDYYGK